MNRSPMEERISDLIDFSGCVSGDCPHVKWADCAEAYKKLIKEFIVDLPEVKELVEILERSLEVRDFEAPEDAEVKALGERIGFGALLDSAVKGWHQSTKEKGYPPGGAFTVGHCYATVESALKALREFLDKPTEPKQISEWDKLHPNGRTCGSQWCRCAE